ncbi:MAG: hypothetical protein LBN40_05690 [Oscillospiraceae bacterium]|jgi:hypothetical protein|nr:hypothetical protein [Oscillospiraceae bacterium]
MNIKLSKKAKRFCVNKQTRAYAAEFACALFVRECDEITAGYLATLLLLRLFDLQVAAELIAEADNDPNIIPALILRVMRKTLNIKADWGGQGILTGEKRLLLHKGKFYVYKADVRTAVKRRRRIGGEMQSALAADFFGADIDPRDFAIIAASIKTCFGIDPKRENLSRKALFELIAVLPSDCVYRKIQKLRGVRNSGGDYGEGLAKLFETLTAVR